jgi:TonB family protein
MSEIEVDDDDGSRAIEVQTLYRGVMIGSRCLSDPGRSHRAPARSRRRRGGRERDFVIGCQAGADAPVSTAYLATPSHRLVAAGGRDYAVNVTPQMTGQVTLGDRVMPLQQFVQQHGDGFALPREGRIRIDCGRTTFLLTATNRARPLGGRRLRWRWDEDGYHLVSAALIGLFLLLISAVPPAPRSLSLDRFDPDRRFVQFLVKPPALADLIPDGLAAPRPGGGGAQASRARERQGAGGSQTAPIRDRAPANRGPRENPDPRLSRQQAADRVRTAGILPILERLQRSAPASIFGPSLAMGADAEDALGNLSAEAIGDAYGVGGLSDHGSGEGGGGFDERTIGLGGSDGLHTIGRRGGGGGGSGYDAGVGALHGRRVHAPGFLPAAASVRGALDKEIVRRIIRRHINEVKYCYEQELVRRPTLGGRITVQFTIAPTGQVLASVLQSSTMANVRVESCTLQAVRRWAFPQPVGGGLVTVSYPFVLTPAGAVDGTGGGDDAALGASDAR